MPTWWCKEAMRKLKDLTLQRLNSFVLTLEPKGFFEIIIHVLVTL